MTMTSTIQVAGPAGEAALLHSIAPLQQQIARHPLYRSIRSLHALQLFMQSHVYAVWDFMSLLKALQRGLTCVELPWRPTGDATSRRLINEIVLGEESDTFEGGATSHYELYLHAMQRAGADTRSIEGLLSALAAGATMESACVAAPPEAAAFVDTTFSLIATGELPSIAAAFTFGREDLIPEMFSSFVRELDARLPGRIAPFRYYLERHIAMDGDEHGPMAMQMMRQLCTTPAHWADAAAAARLALEARLALWDGIYARVLSEAGEPAQSHEETLFARDEA